jgi:hypothetical protein
MQLLAEDGKSEHLADKFYSLRTLLNIYATSINVQLPCIFGNRSYLWVSYCVYWNKL